MNAEQPTTGLLGDTPQRSYVDKLNLFHQFTAPEMRHAISELGLQEGDVVLDAGCGTGAVTRWLYEHVQPTGTAVGLDLSLPHVQEGLRQRQHAGRPFYVLADMSAPPVLGPFDLIWSSNSIGHLRRPLDGVRALVNCLRPGGRLVLGQSVFLPEMMFAWDYRLENDVRLACRRYYHDKYGIDERDTTADRNLLGLLQQSGLKHIQVKTMVIERTAPLTPADERYFVEGVFQAYWGHRLQPYLAPEDWASLEQLCNPEAAEFCLRRPDFHHIQTFTLCSGCV